MNYRRKKRRWGRCRNKWWHCRARM